MSAPRKQPFDRLVRRWAELEMTEREQDDELMHDRTQTAKLKVIKALHPLRWKRWHATLRTAHFSRDARPRG